MISSKFLESNIEKNFSSYENRKKAISDLKVLRKNNIWIESAKIATIGERAEDVFYLRDEYQDAIAIETNKKLESELIESLDG